MFSKPHQARIIHVKFLHKKVDKQQASRRDLDHVQKYFLDAGKKSQEISFPLLCKWLYKLVVYSRDSESVESL